MNNLQCITDWSVAGLEQLSSDHLDRITLDAIGAMAQSRLLLGRCLLVLDRTHAAEEMGFSGAIHYAIVRGVDVREAREARRVAARLEDLSRLREATETGTLPWSMVREITRKAVPETEEQWLALAARCTYTAIEKLVARTGEGMPPGESSEKGTTEHELSEIRLWVLAEVGFLFQQTIRELSQRESRALSPGQVLERLLADYRAGSMSESVREGLREEARKDLLARQESEERELRDAAQSASGIHDPPNVQESERPVRVEEPSLLEDTPEEAPADQDIEDAPWAAVAATEVVCPSDPGLRVARPAAPHWQNTRLRFSGQARLLTSAQRQEILRRDRYACSTPGCPNALWLQVHHIVFYCRGGATVPQNVVITCSRCHRNLHRGRLHVTGTAPDGLLWTNRHGAPLTSPAGSPVIGPQHPGAARGTRS